jgi:hypothetical protein
MGATGYILTQSQSRGADASALELSTLASDRLRAAVFTTGGTVQWTCGAPPLAEWAGELLFVGKPPGSNAEALGLWDQQLSSARKGGAKVVTDYTDHHFRADNPSPLKEFYEKAFLHSDAISTPTGSLKSKLVAEGLDESRIVVIPDVIEQERRQPKLELAHGSESVGLWFGHPSNIGYLQQYLIQHPELSRRLKFLLVTDGKFLSANGLSPGKWARLAEGPLVYPYPWSLKALEEAAGLCDYAILPCGLRDPAKSGASPNRMMSALMLGLPPITHAADSHEPFAAYWVNAENLDEVESTVAHPYSRAEQTEEFQLQIAPQFSKEAVAAQWQQLWGRLLSN